MNDCRKIILVLVAFVFGVNLTFGQNVICNDDAGGNKKSYVVNGTFYDSGGTSNYSSFRNNGSCGSTHTLYPAITGMKVSVQFTSFDVEDEASCGYDYLKIYDGNSTAATLLGTYCGTTSPGTITSTAADGSLTFCFDADGSGIGAGWAATMALTGSPCGGTWYDPGGPSSDYDDDISTFDYTLTPGASQKIEVSFSSFFLETDGCSLNYDWLKLYDGNSTGATLLGCYDVTTPGTITSTAGDGTLTMQFESDGSTNGLGWVASVSCITTCAVPTAVVAKADASAGPLTVCTGSSVALTNTPTGGACGGNWEYAWYDGSNYWTGASFASGSIVYNTTYGSISPTVTANKTYTLTMRCDICPGTTSISDNVVVNIDATTVGGDVDDDAVCGSTNSGTVTLSGHTGSVLKWQYSSASTAWAWVDLAANTTTTQNFTNLTETTKYRAQVQNGACSAAFSTDGTVTYDAPPANPDAGEDQFVCGTTTTMAGTGTGTWTVLNGTATITTPGSNVSGITGLVSGAEATLRWTVISVVCTADDDVVITAQ